jgi:YjbE family integral membrane protein
MIEWLMHLEWNAIVQIIIIDILLGGDNAVIIALACRNLPPKHRRQGIFWGAAGAIILRVILITVAVALLNIPFLKLIGGLLLFWIGIKLIAPPEEDGAHGKVQASDKLLAAIKTIIVADFVMSLDNVIAIAGAAEQADPSQRTGLIIFGLLVSVPFIVFGSQIILKLLDRFPVIVLLGGALLGWIAGGLIVTDPVAVPYIPQTDTVRYIASAAGALVVVAVAKILAARRSPAHGA